MLDTEFTAHLRRQRDWPDLLDSERLTRAFAELDASGIIARESSACCELCARGHLLDELDERPLARGFVYYGEQDALLLQPYLGFGARESDDPAPSDQEVTVIGQEVVATMRRHGLAPEWDGDPYAKILGPSLLRRRTGRLASHPSRLLRRRMRDAFSLVVGSH